MPRDENWWLYRRGGVGWLKLFAWLVQLPVVYQTIIYQGWAVYSRSSSSLWGLRLHYASLSIGRRGKQSQWLPLSRGASKAAAAVACSKLFYERCKAFLIKTPLAQLMKVNNFHFPLSYFFPSKRRCRHTQCRKITFCVKNNSLPFLYSLPLWLGLKIIQVINRVRQRSQLQQWQLCITGRWAWVGACAIVGDC